MRTEARRIHLTLVAGVLCVGLAGCAGTQHAEVGTLPRAASDPVELHELAQALAKRGDFLRAEQYALLAVENGFPERRALPLLVSVCLRSSRVTSALAHAEPVLRAHPDDQNLRFLVASIYAALHRRDDALRELRTVVSEVPHHEQAALLLVSLQGEEAP